jgi:hypothetical protein
MFKHDYDVKRTLRGLSAATEGSIIPDKTQIFLDEIQEIPRAVQALKYFCEDTPEYYIIAAGSLLGIHEHTETRFTKTRFTKTVFTKTVISSRISARIESFPKFIVFTALIINLRSHAAQSALDFKVMKSRNSLNDRGSILISIHRQEKLEHITRSCKGCICRIDGCTRRKTVKKVSGG